MKNGFSLIELIVVMSLILIIFSLSVTNYTRASMEATLDKEARKFSDTLNLARTKANTGDTQACNFTQKAAGALVQSFSYRITVTTGNPSSYVFQAVCNGIARTISTVAVAQNVTITGNQSIEFLSFNSGLTPVESRQFMLIHQGLNGNNCVPVSINRLGVIETGARTSCAGVVANSARCYWSGNICMTLNNCAAGNSPQFNCAGFNVGNCQGGAQGQWRACN